MMTQDTSLVVVRCSQKSHETLICENNGEHAYIENLFSELGSDMESGKDTKI